MLKNQNLKNDKELTKKEVLNANKKRGSSTNSQNDNKKKNIIANQNKHYITEENLEDKKSFSEKMELSINNYVKEEFLNGFTEKEKELEKKFKEKLGKNIKYIESLNETPYSFTSKGLSFIDEETGETKLISNMLIIPIKKYNYNTEEKIESYIELKALIAPAAEELPNITISLKELQCGNWFINPSWGLKMKFAFPIQKERQIDSIKELCKYMEEETIYQYTGFTKIDDNTVFLHHGGAIGLDKPIRVELDDEVLDKYAFTNKNFELKQCLSYTLKCLETAPETITLPLLALTYMAPFSSIFEEIGIPVGFLIWVLGPQQCKKTSLVSAFISHYGNFNKNLAPMNFLDGIPSATEKAAKLKDVLTLCDDYYPSANKQEASEMKKHAEKLISLCADKMTGARSKSNGKMRKTYRAKGQIIVTGELFPELSQSRMSRVLFINIAKTDVVEKKLKVIQEHQEELQYSMKKYLEYIINNLEKIKANIPKLFNSKIKEAGESVTYRTAEMLAGLYIGYLTLIEFVFENDVITSIEKTKMLDNGWNILLQLGKEQNAMVETTSPIKMLETAIKILASSGKIYTFDYLSASFTLLRDIAKDGFIGFYDKEHNIYLIYPELLYKQVKNFYTQQETVFPWSQATMCKELYMHGFLYQTENQGRPQIRRKNPRTKIEETFIGLLRKDIKIAYRYNENGHIKQDEL